MSERQSGRSTRILAEALTHSRETGAPVVFVYGASRSYFEQMAKSLGARQGEIRFIPLGQRESLRGLSESQIFYDHYLPSGGIR